MGRAGPGDIDISMLGDKELQAKLKRLPQKLQHKIAKKALRDSAKRMRPRVAAAAPIGKPRKRRLGVYAGSPFFEETKPGTLRQAFKTTQIRSLRKGRVYGFLGIGINLPTRAELGIEPDDKWYYPMAIEYGAHGTRTHFPAKPFIRPTTDKYAMQEYAQIAKDIGRGIEREARKSG